MGEVTRAHLKASKGSRATVQAVVHAAREKHAEDIVALDVRALSTVADFFVVCTAESGRQIQAIRDHIEVTLRTRGVRLWHAEGFQRGHEIPREVSFTPQWVLMDCGEIIVHVMDHATRAFYQVERLWADAPRVPMV